MSLELEDVVVCIVMSREFGPTRLNEVTDRSTCCCDGLQFLTFFAGPDSHPRVERPFLVLVAPILAPRFVDLLVVIPILAHGSQPRRFHYYPHRCKNSHGASHVRGMNPLPGVLG